MEGEIEVLAAAPMSPDQDYCWSENEGEHSPRPPVSQVPEEFLANIEEALEDEELEELEPASQHALPKCKPANAEADAVEPPAPHPVPRPRRDPAVPKRGAQEQGADEALRQILGEAESERAKAVEDGTLSSGADLWVSQEDGSLYKHSLCSIHYLTHLPKDLNCPICERAKMFYAPARKLANQSEIRQDEQKRFKAREAFDLIYGFEDCQEGVKAEDS